MASFLLPASAITLLLFFLSPAPTNAGVVLDVKGEPLKNHGDYYILSYPNPVLLPYGGLTPIDINSTCPLYIIEQPYTFGSPVTISSMFKIEVIKTSHQVEFYFNRFPTTCNDPLRWYVAKKDSNGESYVIVGTSNPFKPDYNFKIEEAEEGKNVYNIKFCHTKKSTNLGSLIVVDEECNNVGLHKGLLGITPNPTPFVFMRALTPRLAY